MSIKRIGVILSGCGVYDGAEIHESVLTLLALSQLGAESVCFAPDTNQLHVINHFTGEPSEETRNVLVESARLARGAIKPLKEAHAQDLDGIIIPGGFGAAKNLTTWALAGPNGEIEPETKRIILEMITAKKPIGGLCMGPAVIAKALQNTNITATLTVGSTLAPSPYDIAAVNEGLTAAGAKTLECDKEQLAIDENNKLVTAPCYMMETTLAEVFEAIRKVCVKVIEMSK